MDQGASRLPSDNQVVQLLALLGLLLDLADDRAQIFDILVMELAFWLS